MSTRRKASQRNPGDHHGNKNSLRHGFYAKLYTAQEQALLDQPLSLADEQKLLRTKLYRLAAKVTLNKLTQQQLAGMALLSHALHSMANLERTRLLARGNGGPLGQTVLEALSDLDPYKVL